MVEMTIRGVVLQKFPSASAFGKAMGWNRQKASDIVNGRRQPSADEMVQIANAVGITDSKAFMSLFFPSMSTK